MTDTLGRRRASARRALLAVTTALCTGLAAPAFADSPHPNLDANGVDLTDGTFNLRLPVASVGSGQAALPLIAFDGQNDNWAAVYAIRTQASSGYNVHVSLGTTVDDFTVALNGTATSSRGTGATLTLTTGTATYRSLDGVVIALSGENDEEHKTNFCNTLVRTGNCTMLGRTITGKSNLAVTLTWGQSYNCTSTPNPDGSANCTVSYRLNSVSNQAGYAIQWAYANNTVPLRTNPNAAWYQRTSASLKNSGTNVGTVNYANPSAGVYTISTPGGKTWRIAGSGTAITGLRRPSAASDTITISYNAGAVTSVTRDGVTTNYNRSLSGTTATETVTDTQSHVTTIVSDMTKYRPTSVTDALGRTTTMAYDSAGRPTEVTYPEGNKVQYTYDSRGNVTETRLKAKPSVGGTDIATTAGYAATCTDPSCNSPLWTKDANGNQIDYGYDTTTGLVTSITAPAPTTGTPRPQTRLAYTNVSGVQMLTGVSTCRSGSAPSCVGTADETRQTIGYDANLNATSVTTAAGDNSLNATTARTFDAAGNLLTEDGPLSGSADTTTYRWSADREQLGMISADPDGAGALKRSAVRTSYNADGQVTTSELGTVNGTGDTDWAAFSSAQQATAAYDANGRRIADTLTAGGTTYAKTGYGFDGLGQLVCTAVRMDPSQWAGQTNNCAGQTTGPNGPDRVQQRGYDAVGRITSVTDAFGTTEASTETISYTANGQTEYTTDAKGNQTRLIYDGQDRLFQTNFPSPTTPGVTSGTDYQAYLYDPNGNVTYRRTRAGQAFTYAYDALNRLTVKTAPSGGGMRNVYYAYDLLDRPLSARFDSASGSDAVVNAYDALGWATSSTTSMGGTSRTVNSVYDLTNNRMRLTHPDGVYFDTLYDVLGRAKNASWWTSVTGTVPFMAITYDDLGRRADINRASSNTGYSYDAVGRLGGTNQRFASNVGNVTEGYGYNPAGQVALKSLDNTDYAYTGSANANTSYGVNGLNQLTSTGSATVTHDANGNLTGDGTATYVYDAENRMTGSSRSGGTTLAYDPLGRLWQTASPVYGKTQFVYDGDRIAIEYDGDTGSMRRRYMYSPYGDEPILWDEGSAMNCSGTKFLHTDRLGSVVATANCNGNRTALNAYDEYGNPKSGNDGRFGYTGQAWLPDLNLWYYKARMYAPSLGRFMQTDPIGYDDGPNWYNYVGSDPVNENDPSGTKQVCEVPTGSHIAHCVTVDGSGTTSGPVGGIASGFSGAHHRGSLGGCWRSTGTHGGWRSHRNRKPACLGVRPNFFRGSQHQHL